MDFEKFDSIEKTYFKYLSELKIFTIIGTLALAVFHLIQFNRIPLGTAGSAYGVTNWIISTVTDFLVWAIIVILSPGVVMITEWIIDKVNNKTIDDLFDDDSNELIIEKGKHVNEKLGYKPWTTPLTADENAKNVNIVPSNKTDKNVNSVIKKVKKNRAVVFYNSQYTPNVAKIGDLTIFVPGNSMSIGSLNKISNADDIILVTNRENVANIVDFDLLNDDENKNVLVHVFDVIID